ncbi:MAG: cytochrome c biogenesis protein CcdA [Phycisphaeraceae bacterium]
MSRHRLSILTTLILALSSIISTPALAQFAPSGEIVTAQLVWQNPQAMPGDQRALALVLDIADGFHTNPNAAAMPADTMYIPTAVRFEPVDGLLLGQVQFPEPINIEVQYDPEPVASFIGRTIIYIPVVIPDEAALGDRPIAISLTYQACNDQVCFPPKTLTLQTTLAVTDQLPAQTSIPADTTLFADFDPSSFATVYEQSPDSLPASGLLRNDFFGVEFTIDTTNPAGIALVLLIGAAAGVLLNVTPCVLPVIPIKIISLHQAAGHRSRALYLGVIYALGIVLTFVFLGLLVAGLVSGLDALEWGQIFSYPPVSAGLGLIIIAMALGMMGLFTFQLPQSVYALNPSSDTTTGNLLLGVLTAILSTPCTGPMLGATIAWAVKQPPALALGTFTAVGVGMAAPYLLLAAFPTLVDRLPRSGPASELVKQTMGGLLIVVAIFFFGPLIPGRWEWWIIAALLTLTMLYMVVRTFGMTPRLAPRLSVTLLAIILTTSGVLIARTLAGSSPLPWQTFTVEAFEQARADDKHILLKFTADWCGNCHYLEGTLYRTPDVVAVFNNTDYVAFKVDLTAANAPGWPLQRELGAGGGIPLAAVYHPGQNRPTRVLQGLYTYDQLMAELQPDQKIAESSR